MTLITCVILLLLMKAAVCDLDHMLADSSGPNVIQIDGSGRVSSHREPPELDERRLLLEMMMRRGRRKDGPTIIMMPPAPAEPHFASTASYDTSPRASYDSHSYQPEKSCFVTTNICDKHQDKMIQKTLQRTVQKSIETSIKNGLKQALVPMFEELTRRVTEAHDLPYPVAKKYQDDLHGYASKFLDKL